MQKSSTTSSGPSLLIRRNPGKYGFGQENVRVGKSRLHCLCGEFIRRSILAIFSAHFFVKIFTNPFRMLRQSRKLVRPATRTVHDYDSNCGRGGQIYGPDHLAMQETLRKIIQNDINPYTAEWEEAKIYPAHKIMKIF